MKSINLTLIYIHSTDKTFESFIRYYAEVYIENVQVFSFQSVGRFLKEKETILLQPALIILDANLPEIENDAKKVLKIFSEAIPLVPVFVVWPPDKMSTENWYGYDYLKKIENPAYFFEELIKIVHVYYPLPGSLDLRFLYYGVNVLSNQVKPFETTLFDGEDLWQAREMATQFYKSNPKSCGLHLYGYVSQIDRGLIGYYQTDVKLILASTLLFDREILPSRIAEYQLYKGLGCLRQAYVEAIAVPGKILPLYILKAIPS